MPHKINRKTITKINFDGPERVDPEWVERREVWKDPSFEKMDAILQRWRWKRRIEWALEGRNCRTHLLRFYIIADLAVADIARAFKITAHAVRKHKRELNVRLPVEHDEERGTRERRQWKRWIERALEGRNCRTHLLRFYIIADLPAADIARAFKITAHAVRKHKRELRVLK
jgi:DNA-binding CsgD family transcriptional regulator